MTEITIILPKKRMNDANKRKWKTNHHKKPQYLLSEINNEIRNSIDGEVIRALFRNEFHSKYQMR